MKTEQEIRDMISDIREDIKRWGKRGHKISVHIDRGKVEALLWVLEDEEGEEHLNNALRLVAENLGHE